MRLNILMSIGDWTHARRPVALAPAALVLGLLAAADARAQCKPGRPAGNVAVVCEGGIDFGGVLAQSGANNVSVTVKDDGGIDAYNTAIQLGGGSKVSVLGPVWSSNGYGIYAVGTGGQDISISGTGELRAKTNAILAEGRGPQGNVVISNAGSLRGLLNQGGIRATATSTENIRIDLSNTGLIEVGGTGGGMFASAYLNSTVSVSNSGHIIAAGHALRAQGQDVTLRNTGALDIVRNSAGYGIYGEASFTTAKKAEVSIFNDATISFSEASGYGVGIWAQASVSTPDLATSVNRGIAKVTNHGSITGLGGAAGGIHASGKDEAEIVNRGAIQMSSTGAGLRAQSDVKALIDNNASVSAYVGISMSAIDGTATLRNSGTVTGNITDAVYIRARDIDATNTGDLRGGLNSGSGAGLNLLGQYRSTLVNSGKVTGQVAIQATAGGSGGRVSVTNTGILTGASFGMDLLGKGGALIDNAGAVTSADAALQARSEKGAVEVFNTGILTKVGSGSAHRIIGQVSVDRGSVLIDNSGQLHGGAGGGISALMQATGGHILLPIEGDVTVRNSGEMFVGNWGIGIQARLGTATIDNLARIDSDGGGFSVQAARAVINNSGAMDMDGRSEVFNVSASGAADSFAKVVNTGALLLNEKSGYTRAVQIDVLTAPGAAAWGRAELINRADIVSLGTSNAGVLMKGTRADVVLDNSAAIQVQGLAVEARSTDGNVKLRNTGALSSTLKHAVWAFATGAGDVLIDNTAPITAQVGGIYATTTSGVVEVSNRGAIVTGHVSDTYAGGIVATGARAAILNHGDITLGSHGSAILAFSKSSDSDVRITNHGAIKMGDSGKPAIYASAGFSGYDDRSGFLHIDNQGDITGGRGAGIDAFAELSVVITNNRLIETGGTAISMRSRNDGLGSLFNDRNGQLIGNNSYGATVRAWEENDAVFNAGVISNRSAGANAKAVDLAGGNDVMQLEGASKITGIVDGGNGSDALRWGGDASPAAPSRFDLATVGTQYINFERFDKLGSSTWIFEGAGSGIDHLRISQGTARIDGVLTGDVTVQAGGVLGGNGQIDGSVRVEAGGRYAPGASIGSQTLAGLVLDEGAAVQLELDAGGLFDTIHVLGNAQLGGVLEIHFLDASGFEAGWQASFLQAASLSGAFSAMRVSGLNGSAQFSLVAGATGMDIVLTGIQITAVPEPATALLWLLGGLALSRRQLLRRPAT